MGSVPCGTILNESSYESGFARRIADPAFSTSPIAFPNRRTQMASLSSFSRLSAARASHGRPGAGAGGSLESPNKRRGIRGLRSESDLHGPKGQWDIFRLDRRQALLP